MDFIVTGLAAQSALASVALIGYLVVSHRKRKKRTQNMLELTSKLDQANALIDRVECISEQLRRSMANHHSTVTRCREQIQVLSERHTEEDDQPHYLHLQDMLVPTKRLSDDIAHAYDELRQHSRTLKRLKTGRRMG